MFVLGLLSIGQIVVLPGLLALKAMRVRLGLVATAVFSFALSLLINYLLVSALVLMAGYRAQPFYAIFAIETALLGFLYRRPLSTPLRTLGRDIHVLVGSAMGQTPPGMAQPGFARMAIAEPGRLGGCCGIHHRRNCRGGTDISCMGCCGLVEPLGNRLVGKPFSQPHVRLSPVAACQSLDHLRLHSGRLRLVLCQGVSVPLWA